MNMLGDVDTELVEGVATDEVTRKIFDVNVFGIIDGTKVVGPGMVERGHRRGDRVGGPQAPPRALGADLDTQDAQGDQRPADPGLRGTRPALACSA